MFKAILCDDNEIILEGLSQEIHWNEIGIELTGTASDGQEAWTMIQAAPPDILITDIRMPYIDGLSLAKQAKELNSKLAIVVISGYNDFEYARTAVHLGAIDFCLKPIDLDEMNQVLHRTVTRCQQLCHGESIRIEKILRDILYLEHEETELLSLCRQISLDPDQYFCIMKAELHVQDIRKLSENLQFSIEHDFTHLVDRLQSSRILIPAASCTDCTLFLHAAIRTELLQQQKSVIAQIRTVFPVEHSQANLTLASGNPYKGILQVSHSLYECGQALKLRFVKGTNATVYYEEVKNYSLASEHHQLSDELLNIDFSQSVKNQDKPDIDQTLLRLYRQLLKTGGDSFLYATLAVGTLYSRLIRDLDHSGLDIREIFENPMDEFKKVTDAGSLDLLIENMRTSLYQICDYVSICQSRYGKIISQALQYIDQNYHQPSLSIEDAAGFVCLSPSYFSTIFRSETGETFTDYLIRIRMEKAKELMKNTNLKIYEISLRTGYENASYFSTAFKRFEGLSPSEYMASL